MWLINLVSFSIIWLSQLRATLPDWNAGTYPMISVADPSSQFDPNTANSLKDILDKLSRAIDSYEHGSRLPANNPNSATLILPRNGYSDQSSPPGNGSCCGCSPANDEARRKNLETELRVASIAAKRLKQLDKKRQELDKFSRIKEELEYLVDEIEEVSKKAKQAIENARQGNFGNKSNPAGGQPNTGNPRGAPQGNPQGAPQRNPFSSQPNTGSRPNPYSSNPYPQRF